MSQPGVTPIEPSALLRLLLKQLQDGGHPTDSTETPGAGLADRAFLSLWPDEMHLVNPRFDRFVAVRPGRFPVWQTLIQGSGVAVDNSVTNTFGVNAVVSMLIFCQNSADPEMSSTSTLVQNTISITDFIVSLIPSVQMWMPKNSDGLFLLREPARLTDGGFGIQPLSGKNGPWVKGVIDLSLNFEAKLPRVE